MLLSSRIVTFILVLELLNAVFLDFFDFFFVCFIFNQRGGSSDSLSSGSAHSGQSRCPIPDAFS